MLIFANIIQEAFSPLITLFESVLVFVHDHIVGGSWGLAIVGLTVIVRAVMVPLTLRQLRSMQKMQVLAPKLKEIQAKYKEDKQRQNEEVMKFYRENGVNPFGACLPLLLQLPVFISLFYALRENLKIDICGEQLKQYFHVASTSQIPSAKLQTIGCNQVAPHSAKFLFIPDITVQATGAALVVLIVLYVGSQVASTLMMSATAPAGSKGMMLALPFVFVLFIFRFPAGLLVYWITTNLWTMGQPVLRQAQYRRPTRGDCRQGPGDDGRRRLLERGARRTEEHERRARARGSEFYGRGPSSTSSQEEETLGSQTMSQPTDDNSYEDDDPAELLEELLAEVTEGLGLECEVVVEQEEDVLRGNIEGEDVGLLIGRRGQTIDALQHLAQRIVFPGGQSTARVIVDADGYRERRAQVLREEADGAAEESLRSGKPVELDPMPASERRVVHEYLRERGDVQTHSEGEEPERYLVVSPSAP